MKPKVRWGLIVGLMGMVANVLVSFVLGLCGPLVALVVGAIAGAAAVGQVRPTERRQAAEEGGAAGAIAGLVVALGQVIGGLIALRSVLSGAIPLPFDLLPEGDPSATYAYWVGGVGSGLCLGFVGLILAALAGAAAGYVLTAAKPSTEGTRSAPNAPAPAQPTPPPAAAAQPPAAEATQVHPIGLYRLQLGAEDFRRLLAARYGQAELTPAERTAAERALRAELAYVVAVELLVENADARFRLDSFRQPEAEGPAQGVYLTPGGSTTLPWTREPSSGSFRLVFYLSDYRPGLPLETPYGPLELPPASAMPERIARLAPHEGLV